MSVVLVFKLVVLLLLIFLIARFAYIKWYHKRQSDVNPNLQKGDIVSVISIKEMQADFGINLDIEFKGKPLRLSVPQSSRNGDLLRLKWHGKSRFRHAYFLIEIVNLSSHSIVLRVPIVRDIIMSQDGTSASVVVKSPDAAKSVVIEPASLNQIEQEYSDPVEVEQLPTPAFIPQKRGTSENSSSSTNSSAFPELQGQINELAKVAWNTEASLRHSQFSLNLNTFGTLNAPSQIIEAFLRHANIVSPGLGIPTMLPRVLITPMASLAGTFEEDEEGYVTIRVSSNFSDDQLAAQAILAHEVCHYILENAGIRKTDFLLNEKMTDLCMFVCGFGDIFLRGYKRDAAKNDYRPGHRLGYLADEEYRFASHYVTELRRSGKIKPLGELEKIKKSLLHKLHGDLGSYNRQIQAERQRSPHKSEMEIHEDLLFRLERDLGR
jgi:hypothetical protein